MRAQRLTVRDIHLIDKEHRNSQQDYHLKYNLWGRYVLREVSYYPAWLFLRVGLSPNLITAISITIGLIGCLLMAIGNYVGMITGVLLLILWALLDYTDGQVARCSNSASNYGKFLDFLGDSIVSALLFVCLGIGIYNHPDTCLNPLLQLFSTVEINRSIFLILGGWASVFYIFPLMIGYQFERLFQKDFAGFASQLRLGKLSARLVQKLGYNLHNTTGLIMPILLLAAIFEFMSLVIFLWALIGTFTSIIMAAQMLREAKSRIN